MALDFSVREYWDRLAVVTGLYNPDLSYLKRGATLVRLKDEGGGVHKFAAHPGQIELLDALCGGERFVQAVCGARWGKSKWGGFLAGGGLMQANKNIWAVAPSYEQGRKILGYTLDTLEKAGMVHDVHYKFKESRLIITTRWGSFFQLKSAEREYSLDSEELDFVVEEEGAKYKPRVRNRIRPRLIDRQGQDYSQSTPVGHNYFYNMFEGEEFYSLQSPTAINPFLPPGELELMKEHYDPLSYKQEIEAQFVAFAGMVFFMFERGTHCVQPGEVDISDWPVSVVVDPGLRDPCAITWFANSGGSGSGSDDYIIRSIRKKDMLFPEVAQIINKYEPERGYEKYIYDPYGGDKRSQETNHNFRTWMEDNQTDKFGNSIYFKGYRSGKQERIISARSRMLNMKNQIKLKIVNCPETQTIIRSVENWHYPESETNTQDKPVHDINSHECDNICNYCGYNYGGRIETKEWIA